MDGITAPKMVTVPSGTPLVMGPGQRYDVLIKAGAPGTYQLQVMDPAMSASVTPSGIDPQTRNSRMSFDFPSPCSTNPLSPQAAPSCAGQFTYPFPLATIVVDGDPADMQLPTGPLPVPKGLPSMDTMLNTTPTAERHLAFEICGEVMTSPSFVIAMGVPEERPPSCGWYFAKYDATYWGGTPFRSLEMLRDDDDKGVPNNDPNEPLVNFVKDGLFNPDQPLFDDMIAGTYEEWTVLNRSFSDHPFHIHQNHFLLTKINGKPLPTPEWHDTVIVPASQPQPNSASPNVNINAIPPGSITFRIYFNPVTVGCFVVHCHTLTHEDLGMMQRLDILPGPGQPNQCEIQAMSHTERSRLAAIDKARIGGTFTLVNATGKPVTDRDFLNKYLLVYFGYTYCPDNCPITLMTLTQALDKLGPKAERIQPVFITVDPKRDTPSVIGQYTAAFSPRLIGLTGSVEQIAATEKEYRVYVAKQRTGPGPNDYAIEHSSIIYLIGPDGRFIAPVRADQDGTAMATEIASYLR